LFIDTVSKGCNIFGTVSALSAAGPNYVHSAAVSLLLGQRYQQLGMETCQFDSAHSAAGPYQCPTHDW
jgi:hypothetical protein